MRREENARGVNVGRVIFDKFPIFVIGFLLALNLIPALPILSVVGFILVGLSYILLVLGLFVKGL